MSEWRVRRYREGQELVLAFADRVCATITERERERLTVSETRIWAKWNAVP